MHASHSSPWSPSTRATFAHKRCERETRGYEPVMKEKQEVASPWTECEWMDVRITLPNIGIPPSSEFPTELFIQS